MRRAISSLLPIVLFASLPACGARTFGLYDPDGALDTSSDASTDAHADATPDASFDTAPLDSAPFDGAFDSAFDSVIDVPSDGYTVGLPCPSSGVCPGGGPNPPECSSSLIPGFPTPVCIEYGCDAGDGTMAVPCGTGTGLCLSTGVGSPGICLPTCGFDASGNFTSKCAGSDGCNFYTYQYDPSGAVTGTGYCYGGCARDADCAAGERCQPETGLCTTSLVTYPLAIGATCTDVDYQNGRCVCLYAGGTSTPKGYCSQTCRMGAGPSCPAGFTCDAFIPKTDPASGSPLFSTVPAGLEGYCLKNCATDADCASYGGSCYENAGTGRKTCQFYPAP